MSTKTPLFARLQRWWHGDTDTDPSDETTVPAAEDPLAWDPNRVGLVPGELAHPNPPVAPAPIDAEGHLGDRLAQEHYEDLLVRHDQLRQRRDIAVARRHHREQELASWGVDPDGIGPMASRTSSFMVWLGLFTMSLSLAITFTFAIKTLLVDQFIDDPVRSLVLSMVPAVAFSGALVVSHWWSARHAGAGRSLSKGLLLGDLVVAAALLCLRLAAEVGGELELGAMLPLAPMLRAVGWSTLELGLLAALYGWADTARHVFAEADEHRASREAALAQLSAAERYEEACQQELGACQAELAAWRRHVREVEARGHQLGHPREGRHLRLLQGPQSAESVDSQGQVEPQ